MRGIMFWGSNNKNNRQPAVDVWPTVKQKLKTCRHSGIKSDINYTKQWLVSRAFTAEKSSAVRYTDRSNEWSKKTKDQKISESAKTCYRFLSLFI